MTTTPHRFSPLVAVLAIVVVAAIGYGGYRLYTAYQAQIAAYQSNVETLRAALDEASTTNNSLSEALVAEQARNDNFQQQINELNGTVGTLNKLANTDPQLLAKYSKVYFLNENYVPASLSNIPSGYTFPDDKDYQFLSDALPHLEDMINAANHAGDDDVQVLSAYRSFSDQAALKSEYKVTYGSGANAFSADQGYSEHQLGTAVDFTTKSLAGGLDGFDKTDAYAWMVANAYKYGFILSYPAGNTYYEYEPWHWRFVGKTLATRLHNAKENFYDMDQRDINEYLIDFPN